MKHLLAVFLFFGFYYTSSAQFPEKQTSSEIYHQLLKLGNTSTVLYMAAHPDDENTRLISYFENNLHSRVAYLSLTRGDGGQNLIGTEIGRAIGVLRTQELLQARRIDGGEQFFTRAVDFGYSKSADESFDKWGKKEILRDVVWVIRKFRPDVIVTRFPPTNYAGHGHHQASAILAEEAFDAAANPEMFPEQLEWVEPWKVKRLYFNSSTWWDKELASKAKNSEDYIAIDIGDFNPILGESYAQIAARSRSQHKSQGFGSDYPYGRKIEYIKYVKGDKADPMKGVLDGLNTGWKRLNAEALDERLEDIIGQFDLKNPSGSLEDILDFKGEIETLENSPLKNYKLKEIDDIALALAGVDGSYNSDRGFAVPGSEISTRIEIVNTSGADVIVDSITAGGKTWEFAKNLTEDDLFSEELLLTINPNSEKSNPYWLDGDYTNIYTVNGYGNLGKPENDPSIQATVSLRINGRPIDWMLPLKQKIVDPAKALILNPFYITPELSASFDEKVLIASDTAFKPLRLIVKNYGPDYSGTVSLELGEGWTSEPNEMRIEIAQDSDALLNFKIKRDEKAGSAKLQVMAEGFSKPLDYIQEIDYDHIPKQIISRPAEVDLISIDLNKGETQTIGYIDGPGDDVAKYLKAAGYEVTHVSDDQLKSVGSLKQYDAIVTGIRAYNTRPELSYANEILNQYVASGGTWVVQYNTSRGLKSGEIGPYPFEISRERVTKETAEARLLVADHPILNYPNKIEPNDFDDWVQERGLYFAGEWDSAFEPIISWNDPEEPPRNGGLIVAPYGKGYFVYTGISFFRELPAGVPGAYRLLANIIALGEQDKSKE